MRSNGEMQRRALLFAALIVTAITASTAVHAGGQETPPAAQPDPKDREKSRAAFKKGVAQLRAQEWAAARASFEAAWSLYPHPSILLNLGIARLKTDDPVLAEQDLLRFLAEDPGAAPDELAGAREALAESRGRIGTIRVTASPKTARVVVDGKPVERVRAAESAVIAEQRVKAGPHAVRVDADGYVPDERTVEAAAKADTEVDVALTSAKDTQPPVETSSTRKAIGWTLVGAGGVALVAGGAMALRAMSLSDDYGDASNPSTFQNADVRSEGIAFRTGADVAVGVAVVCVAAGLVLLLTNVGASRPADVALRF